MKVHTFIEFLGLLQQISVLLCKSHPPICAFDYRAFIKCFLFFLLFVDICSDFVSALIRISWTFVESWTRQRLLVSSTVASSTSCPNFSCPKRFILATSIFCSTILCPSCSSSSIFPTSAGIFSSCPNHSSGTTTNHQSRSTR